MRLCVVTSVCRAASTNASDRTLAISVYGPMDETHRNMRHRHSGGPTVWALLLLRRDGRCVCSAGLQVREVGLGEGSERVSACTAHGLTVVPYYGQGVS